MLSPSSVTARLGLLAKPKQGTSVPFFSMNIYLEHPIHGRKIASIEAEAEHDEKHGWLRYNPDTLSEEEAAPVNVLEVKRRRKAITEEV